MSANSLCKEQVPLHLRLFKQTLKRHLLISCHFLGRLTKIWNHYQNPWPKNSRNSQQMCLTRSMGLQESTEVNNGLLQDQVQPIKLRLWRNHSKTLSLIQKRQTWFRFVIVLVHDRLWRPPFPNPKYHHGNRNKAWNLKAGNYWVCKKAQRKLISLENLVKESMLQSKSVIDQHHRWGWASRNK